MDLGQAERCDCPGRRRGDSTVRTVSSNNTQSNGKTNRKKTGSIETPRPERPRIKTFALL